MDIDTLPVDEYDRVLVPTHAIPPPGTGHFMIWRGHVVTPEAPRPANTVTPRDSDHRLCVEGWFPSGDWWLHCGRCR